MCFSRSKTRNVEFGKRIFFAEIRKLLKFYFAEFRKMILSSLLNVLKIIILKR